VHGTVLLNTIRQLVVKKLILKLVTYHLPALSWHITKHPAARDTAQIPQKAFVHLGQLQLHHCTGSKNAPLLT